MLNGDIDVLELTGDITNVLSLEGNLLPIGPKGDKGDPGFSPVVTTSKSGKTTTVKFETATGNVYAYIQDGEDGQGSGDMMTDVYDQNKNGIVDNAEKVNNHTVEKDVPANADFSDTKAVWGNISGDIDNQTDLNTKLEDYVKFTNYATNSKGGVIKTDTSAYGTAMYSGYLTGSTKTYAQYGSSANALFVSKGTLENVITGKELVNKDVNNLTNYANVNESAQTSEEDVASATFTNTLEAPMNIDLKGNTLQNGTPTPSSPIPINNVSGDNDIVVCGSNIFIPTLTNNGTDIQHSNCNVSLTNDEFSLTSTGSNIRIGEVINTNNNYTYSAGVLYNVNGNSKLYVKCTNTDFNGIFITVYGSDKKSLGYTQLTSEEYTFPANAVYFSVRFGLNGSTTGTTYKTKVMVSFTPITTYEAYNGTTYNIDLPVENLFDKDNANIENGYIDTVGMVLITSQLNRLFYIPCKPNTTYTISRSIITSTFRVATYDSTPFPSATSSSLTYSISGLIKDNSATSITITTGANAKYLIVHYGRVETDPNIEESLATIQVEEGSKPNSYTPYGTTPIKLNKIGTYQDYIYKENDKWYLHKEIGKYLALSSDVSAFGNPGVSGINGATITLNDMLTQNYGDGLSTHFFNKKSTKDAGTIRIGGNDKNVYLYVSANTYPNTQSFKDYLDSNDVYIYYLFATPINTEITYTNLINQLESIKNAMSKQGATNVNQVNNDAPFILDLSVFNDTYNGRYQSVLEMYKRLKEAE